MPRRNYQESALDDFIWAVMKSDENMAYNVAQLGVWLLGSANEPGNAARAMQSQLAANSLIEQANYHKVGEITAVNIESLRAEARVSAQLLTAQASLKAEAEKERKNSSPSQEEFAELERFCRANDLVMNVIKGKRRAPLYPLPYARHAGDMDILLPDVVTAGKIIHWLRDRGYSWDPDELPWLKKWTPGGDGRLYGQAPLRREDVSSQYVFRYDIHFGGYSIGNGGFLPFESVRDSWEGELAILLGHALGEGFFTVKDLNDWRMIIATQFIDWDNVHQLVQDSSLESVLRAMEQLDTWQARFEHEPVTKPPQSLPIYHKKYGRAFRVARHTFGTSRKLGGPAIPSLCRAVESFAYYALDHSLFTRRRVLRSPQFDERTTNRWTCWRLIPVNKQTTGCVQYFGTDFWPTVWYDVPPVVLKEVVF